MSFSIKSKEKRWVAKEEKKNEEKRAGETSEGTKKYKSIELKKKRQNTGCYILTLNYGFMLLLLALTCNER